MTPRIATDAYREHRITVSNFEGLKIFKIFFDLSKATLDYAMLALSIPILILDNLLQFAVSKFSKDLIVRMADDPLFNIIDINRRLLQKVKTLQRITLYRLQLRFSRPFLASCRLGTE